MKRLLYILCGIVAISLSLFLFNFMVSKDATSYILVVSIPFLFIGIFDLFVGIGKSRIKASDTSLAFTIVGLIFIILSCFLIEILSLAVIIPILIGFFFEIYAFVSISTSIVNHFKGVSE